MAESQRRQMKMKDKTMKKQVKFWGQTERVGVRVEAGVSESPEDEQAWVVGCDSKQLLV